MATTPIAPSPPAAQEAVEQRLRRLEAVWRAETAHLSSSSRIVSHPAFREIVAMGPGVVPILLRDLERAPGLWVWALSAITGADPIPESDRGNITRMTQAWLRRARDNGYQW